jgi:hypothetical protein
MGRAVGQKQHGVDIEGGWIVEGSPKSRHRFSSLVKRLQKSVPVDAEILTGLAVDSSVVQPIGAQAYETELHGGGSEYARTSATLISRLY